MTDTIFILSFLSSLLFLTTILLYLEGRKIQQKFIDLFTTHNKTLDKLNESETKRRALLDQIKSLQWQIDNPPKYKKGDKVGDLIISSCILHKPTLGEMLAKGAATLFLSLLIGRSKDGREELNKDFQCRISTHYIYELTHTTNGNKETKTEFELTELLNSKQ